MSLTMHRLIQVWSHSHTGNNADNCISSKRMVLQMNILLEPSKDPSKNLFRTIKEISKELQKPIAQEQLQLNNKDTPDQ